MWIMLKYKQLTPMILTHLSVFDSVLSYGLASLRNFDLRKDEDIYKAEYGYIDDLPITKTVYEKGWFYNISLSLFSNPVIKYTYLSRKFIPDRFIYENRHKDIYSIRFTEKENAGVGREKAIMDRYRTVQSDYVYVILETNNEREIIDIADKINFIGKKSSFGFGQVKLVDYYNVDVKDFVYKDILIRPVPTSLVNDRGYGIIKTRIRPPYYIKDEMCEDVCYIDKRLFTFKQLQLEEGE
ncbi:MAG: hypothetical protein QW478_09045 [Candidatus Micrarchaeaceae archaeon]